MFTEIPQPLAYAETLLGTFASLSRVADDARLLEEFTFAVGQLTGSELAQVYLLDAGHSQLGLSAECFEGGMQSRQGIGVSADYHTDELLQFSLCQNRVLCLEELGSGLYQTSFLPPSAGQWRTLLSVPLVNALGVVEGVLICASLRLLELKVFAESLGQLGRFVLAQLALLQRLRSPTQPLAVKALAVGCASGYGLIGKSAAMRSTYQLIGKVLHSPYTILLTGETGTGKEVVARALHECGPRRSKKFIVQNCAAFPESLLESELFGYCKGAFTGADRDRKGLFDAAEGGTLLLDEIGDMPLSLQAKLLRVLQEGEIRPLGSNDTHKIDVRIIAATHRDLLSLVAEGKFREDLYYRLAQFPIELPPLRQRDADILELARYFAAKACVFIGREPLGWSEAALAHLSGYAFPGNVRELKGLVERAVLLCEAHELLPEHFSLNVEAHPEDSTLYLRDYMERVERAYVLSCLRRNGGNQTLAARQLGLPRRTLLYRLGRLSVDLSEFQEGTSAP
ncbi:MULTISPECIES: sigma 54-interacting transcriptional regulator [Pseudomonas]|uniref:sigma-54 interaction domain-containing protein n=1 Tax=Pseudomonas TaxID=286 RepID=UPI000CD50421|nr:MULTISPECIES: sigma 54-interacting transcriptional regulator [Pseudomonas]RBH52969.1 sigma-54-dependent Fis family transcriptional regulator [Pseudomonas sp. MWU13-2860]